MYQDVSMLLDLAVYVGGRSYLLSCVPKFWNGRETHSRSTELGR